MKGILFFCVLMLLSCEQQEPLSNFDSSVLNSNSRFNLVVFFSEDDCIACIFEITIFNDLNNDISPNNLSVIGIIENIDELELISNKIDFQVIENKDLYNQYSTGSTPEAYLIDTKRNNSIVYRSFKKKTLSSQQATYDIVNLIVRNQY